MTPTAYSYYLEGGFLFRESQDGSILQVRNARTSAWTDLPDRGIGFHAIWYGSQLTEQQAADYVEVLQDLI